MTDLKELRNKIDDVDANLLKLLECRMQISADVAEYKKSVGKPVYDAVREEEKIEAIKAMISNESNKSVIADLFKQIMTISRRLQYSMSDAFINLGFSAIDGIDTDKEIKVAYFGEKGSYTEQAMLEYFKTVKVDMPMHTFKEIIHAVSDGEVDYGVLPIENSATGTLSDIYDLLAEYDNLIIGEHLMSIEHNLWGLAGTDLSDISTIYSHRQGLLQCSDFLKNNSHIELIERGSTAACARWVLEKGDSTKAAIASKRAGEYLGLTLISKFIQNDDSNATRFIIITNKKEYIKGANRTSICFEAPHKSGSLYHILANFIYNNINMTRIESRPIPGKAFKYRFFVDIDGNLEEPSIRNALHNIKEETLEMKILGCFISKDR